MGSIPVPGIVKFCCSVLHALVLIVAIPLAQHILNGAKVSLPSAIMYPCSTPFAKLDSDATIVIPGLFGAALQPYNAKLSTESKDAANRTIKVEIGHALFPEMRLNKGTNAVDFSTGVALDDTTTLLNDFILPMFAQNKTAKLFIDVDNITLTAFNFLKIPNLHMQKALVCHGASTTKSKEIPDKYCKPQSMDTRHQVSIDSASSVGTQQLFQQLLARRLLSDQNQGYQIVCIVDEGPTVVV